MRPQHSARFESGVQVEWHHKQSNQMIIGVLTEVHPERLLNGYGYSYTIKLTNPSEIRIPELQGALTKIVVNEKYLKYHDK